MIDSQDASIRSDLISHDVYLRLVQRETSTVCFRLFAYLHGIDGTVGNQETSFGHRVASPRIADRSLEILTRTGELLR